MSYDDEMRRLQEQINWAAGDPSRADAEMEARAQMADMARQRGGGSSGSGGAAPELLATLTLSAVVATIIGAIGAGVRRRL